MNRKVIQDIEKEQIKRQMPAFNVGDIIKVFAKIKEGDKERLQPFEGIVISKKGGSNKETFTVRRVFQDVGVERIFPLHSPKIESIKLISTGKVRRAKLFYLRDSTGKNIIEQVQTNA